MPAHKVGDFALADPVSRGIGLWVNPADARDGGRAMELVSELLFCGLKFSKFTAS